jgi:cytochrome P450
MISNAPKSAASSDEKLSAIRQFNTLFPKLKSALDERRKNLLKDDFLSAVFQQEVEAEEGNADFKTPITDEEMCAMVTGLLVAGTDTTIDLLNLSMYQFLSFPEQKKVALRNSESLEKAIMEVLRHDYFISGGIGRFAVADFNFKGHDIKKGEMLRLLIGAASRDGRMYENPDLFDVTRSYKDSLAFGYGSHYCVGASLAKMESVIAIGMFFEKFPNARLLGQPVWDTTHPVSRRMKSLPVQLH